MLLRFLPRLTQVQVQVQCLRLPPTKPPAHSPPWRTPSTDRPPLPAARFLNLFSTLHLTRSSPAGFDRGSSS
ncbi:hypothetical protein VPH35_119349 [Triticum aestivum]